MNSLSTRLANATNPYQGRYKRVLCVCSAGLLRSPTAAWILSNKPYDFNTRACGIEDYALIKLDDILLEWAEVIICFTEEQLQKLRKLTKKPAICLNIEDDYYFRAPKLVKLLKNKFKICLNSFLPLTK